MQVLSKIKKILPTLQKICNNMYNSWRFAQFGKGSMLLNPLQIDFPKRIFIGKKVLIKRNAWLAANPLTGSNICQLIIKDGTYIGSNAHIYCTQKIGIEENVLMADRIYISDNSHSYENINTPIINQPIKQLNEVVIGTGAWLGENVCIVGASVGKNSVIAANSVVTKNIPDYCIAAGSPAKVIKKYNFETKQWEKVHC
jgi:acetyltransferase-like isoleucine patch superfamily enzyme